MHRVRTALSVLALGIAGIAAPFVSAAPAHAAGTGAVLSTPTNVSPGTRSAAVLTIKHGVGYLMNDAALRNSTDTLYDAATVTKVKNIQTMLKLPATGTVDANTWRALFMAGENASASLHGFDGNAPTIRTFSAVAGGISFTYNCAPGSLLVGTDITFALDIPVQYTATCSATGTATIVTNNRGLVGWHTLSFRTISPAGVASYGSFISGKM